MQETQRRRQALHDKFCDAITLLGGNPARVAEDIEQILDSYMQPTRHYHDLKHIETLTRPLREIAEEEKREGSTRTIADALQLDQNDREKIYDAEKVVSALGHDCVYQIADNGLGSCEKLLEPYLVIGENGKPALKPVHTVVDEAQQLAQLVYALFGVSDLNNPNNELLSALATATVMQRAGVSNNHIAAVVCQIESTVPFRPDTPSAALRNRLQDANRNFKLGMDEETRQQRITQATLFANEDVKNFRGPLGPFIHNTFLLAPENNPFLRGRQCTPGMYLEVLHRNLTRSMPFFQNISGHIFRDNAQEGAMQYPPAEQMKHYQESIERNLKNTSLFLKAKLVTLGYLQALTTQLGNPEMTLEELMPHPDFRHAEAVGEGEVYTIMKHGGGGSDIFTMNEKGERVRFDLNASPLTAFLWEKQGQRKMMQAYDVLEDYVAACAGGRPYPHPMPALNALRETMGPELSADLLLRIKQQAPFAASYAMERNFPLVTGQPYPQPCLGMGS